MSVTERPRQTNCKNEPPYPDHETVVFCLSAPDMTAHLPNDLCSREHPHDISGCGVWQHDG